MSLPSELIQVALQATHNAAIACYEQIGNGNKELADHHATEAMRQTLNEFSISGTVVIGEGEMDEAPMLYNGEKLGKGGFECDIAVDPLEGTKLCAYGKENSITTIALAPKGTILSAPDMYMDKIASCSIHQDKIIDLTYTIEQNIKNVSEYKQKPITDVGICVLDRERHKDIISKARALGAKIYLISDGDIAGILQTYYNHNIDFYIGSGGAPEGILAAAAIKSLKGFMQGKLLFEDTNQLSRAKNMGIIDKDKIYNVNEMIKSDAIFAATGVTNGFLKGVEKKGPIFATSSLVTHSGLEMIQNITAYDANT